MRDHELELIAALVEGRLDDETEARALIAASEEARDEYEAQKRGYDSLRALGTAHLTETERASLHRDLWAELRRREAPAKKAPWYLRWGPVAAGLFVVVGLAAVLGQGMPQGASDQFATAGEESASAPSTTAAASEGTADLLADDGAETATTQSGGDAAGAGAGEDEALYAADAERVRAGDFSGDRLSIFTTSESADSQMQACVDEALDEAGLDGYEPVALVSPDEEENASQTDDTTTTTAGEPSSGSDTAEFAVAVPEGAEPAEAPLAFVDVQTCDVVYLDQPTD